MNGFVFNLLSTAFPACILTVFLFSSFSDARGSTVSTWGDWFRPTPIPADLTNAVAVSAGGSHILVLKADKTVAAFGGGITNSGLWPNYGQSIVPSSLTNALSISAGYVHSLAATAEGVVLAWGAGTTNSGAWPNYGQSILPLGLTNVIAVSAGPAHSLALRSDHTVVAWGAGTSNSGIGPHYGQSIVPSSLTNVIAIAAGSTHSLALKDDGTVVAWGDNSYGQTAVPQHLTNVVAIAAGQYHSLALQGQGTVVSWGQSFYYQSNMPAGLSDVVAISAGNTHSLALRMDGSVVAWGNNLSGETSVPSGLTNAMAIDGGSALSVALIGDGSPFFTVQPHGRTLYDGRSETISAATVGAVPMTYQWRLDGINIADATNSSLAFQTMEFGETGVYDLLVSNVFGVTQSHGVRFTVISSGPIIVQAPTSRMIYVGEPVIFEVKSDGSGPLFYQWFFNGDPLSDETNSSLILPAAQLASAGLYHVVVSNIYGSAESPKATLTLDPSPPFIEIQPTNQVIHPGGTVTFRVQANGAKPLFYQWRYFDADIPEGTNAVLTLSNATASRAGDYSIVVSNSYGSVDSSNVTLRVLSMIPWGIDYYGVNQIPPDLTNVVAISIGGYHSLALTADGKVRAWGVNWHGETDVPQDLTNVVAVSAGYSFSLALRKDGRVVHWGVNWYGLADIPASLTNVVAIAAGNAFSLALKADGTVVAWGLAWYDATTVPADLTNVVAISAGHHYGLALKNDGTVAAWGFAEFGVTEVPPDLRNVVAISAGAYYCLALKRDGTVAVWGTGEIPLGWTDVIAIAAGDSYALALRADGTVYGATDVPTGLTNIVAITAGIGRSLVLANEHPTRPIFVHCARNTNLFEASFATELGKTYRVESKNSLLEADWNLLVPQPGDGTIHTMIDPRATSSQRFFQLRQIQ